MIKNIKNHIELQTEIARLKNLTDSQWEQLGEDIHKIRDSIWPGKLLMKIWSVVRSWSRS